MILGSLRACLHEGGEPQVGEVTCGGLPHLTCKRDHINCVNRRVTPPKQVTSPTWSPSPPWKQALSKNDGGGYENVTYKVKKRCFKLYLAYSISFNSSNVGNLNSNRLFRSLGKEKESRWFRSRPPVVVHKT